MTEEEIRLKREAVQILLTFFRCVVMKRALQGNVKSSLNFFALYDGCLMDMAIISWWKIFGEHKDFVNWKKLVSKEKIKDLNNQYTDFETLRRDIKKYRDKHVAHHEFNQTTRPRNYPFLDPLYDTALCLYKIIYADLNVIGRANGLPRPENFDQENRAAVEMHWANIAMVASSAVEHFQDNPDI